MRLTQGKFRRPSLAVLMIFLLTLALTLLMILDFFNLESLAPFNEGGFYFDYSWKGRMFLLFFLAIFILEYVTNRGLPQVTSDSKNKRLLRYFLALLFASLPLIWIFSVNFLGLDKVVVSAGDFLRGDYWREVLANNPNDPNSVNNFLSGDWPLSVDYLVFTISFIIAVFLAHGRAGLKAYSISLALIGGIGAIFLVDTLFPYGALKPLQMLALPTSACAASFLEFLGFKVSLAYLPAMQSSPMIMIYPEGGSASANINWPCAGVHSLFPFTLIMVLLLNKSGLSLFRKTLYFIMGFVITYFVNVLRIVVYFIILYYNGSSAAAIYHSDYGELLFVGWVGLYILFIILIEKLKIVEKIQRLSSKVCFKRYFRF